MMVLSNRRKDLDSICNRVEEQWPLSDTHDFKHVRLLTRRCFLPKGEEGRVVTPKKKKMRLSMSMQSCKDVFCCCILLCLWGIAVLVTACTSPTSSPGTSTSGLSSAASPGVHKPPENSTPQAGRMVSIVKKSSGTHLTFACRGTDNAGTYSLTEARVCIQTFPHARMTLDVIACGMNDQNSILKKEVAADDTGYYEWHWTPQISCGDRKEIAGGVSVDVQTETERILGSTVLLPA